jgi:hypothetical protein
MPKPPATRGSPEAPENGTGTCRAKTSRRAESSPPVGDGHADLPIAGVSSATRPAGRYADGSTGARTGGRLLGLENRLNAGHFGPKTCHGPSPDNRDVPVRAPVPSDPNRWAQ